jgi:predicted dehydrogenase
MRVVSASLVFSLQIPQRRRAAARPRAVESHMTQRASSKPIRYGVVGLGYIAQIAVLPAFAHARRNSRLHALISSDPHKLAELGDKYRVPVRGTYDTYEECLKEVDAVFICTPNSQHAEHTIRAAHAGVHVLCEKPLAVTDEECARMIATCREANVKLMTAYRLHFEPLTLEVLDLVRRGEIGSPRYFSSSFSMQATPGGIRTQQQTGGGTLYDLGVYCINAARMLFGAEPRQVFASSVSGARSSMPEIDEMTSALLMFAEGRLATFTTSFAAGGVSTLRIAGTKGDIHMEPAYEYAEALKYTLTVDEEPRNKRGRKHDQFAAELLYFSDCILNNRDPEPSGDEGARDVRVVNALYESARRGRPIDLPPLDRERRPTSAQAMALPPVREPELIGVEKPHD